MADRHILYTLDMKGNLAPKSKELASHLHLVGKEAKATETKVADLRKLVASFGGDVTATGGRLLNLVEGLKGLGGSLGKVALVAGGTGLAVAGLGIAISKAGAAARALMQDAGESEKRIRGLGLVTFEQAMAVQSLATALKAQNDEMDAAKVKIAAEYRPELEALSRTYVDLKIKAMEWGAAALSAVGRIVETGGQVPINMLFSDQYKSPNAAPSTPGPWSGGYVGAYASTGGVAPAKTTSSRAAASFSLPGWMSSALSGNAEMMANLNSSIMAGQSAATLGSFLNAPTGASGVAAAMARGQQANFAAAGIGSIAPPPDKFLPGLGKTLGAGVGGLATGLSTVAAGGNIAPGLLGMLGGPAGMLASTLAGQLTTKGGDIGKMTEGLIDQAKAVPTIVKGIVEAVPDIITALIEAAPEILQSLVKVLIELPIILIKGIGEAIKDIFTTTDEERATRAANDASRGTIRGRSGYIESVEEKRSGSSSRVIVINNSGDPVRNANELRKVLGPYGRGATLNALPV